MARSTPMVLSMHAARVKSVTFSHFAPSNRCCRQPLDLAQLAGDLLPRGCQIEIPL